MKRYVTILIAVCVVLGLSACQDTAGSDTGDLASSAGDASAGVPDLSAVTAEDDAGMLALLSSFMVGVESVDIDLDGGSSGGPYDAPYARATVRVAEDDDAAMDRAAFVMFDILQRSVTPGTNIHVAIEATETVPVADVDTNVRRLYQWDAEFEYPYDVPEGRQDHVAVWEFNVPTSDYRFGCITVGDSLGWFTGIDAERVTAAALGDVPVLEEPVYFPGEYESRDNGLGFGFTLPEQLDAYVPGVEYSATCVLGYSGADPRGRPLYDISLYLPYGSVIEFVVRDAVTGQETVSRNNEGPYRELILSPETGFAEQLRFSFPEAGRYEVFLRIAGGANSARTKGIWLDVPAL